MSVNIGSVRPVGRDLETRFDRLKPTDEAPETVGVVFRRLQCALSSKLPLRVEYSRRHAAGSLSIPNWREYDVILHGFQPNFAQQ